MIMQLEANTWKGVCMNMIPAVREPASIAPFFKALARTTVPGKVDANFMAGIGFRRQSDDRLLELLKFLGFMDGSFQPTDLWRSYFSAPEEETKLAILGGAVAERYAEAIRTGWCRESSRLNGKAVMAFFKGETGAGETETAYMVLTLQILLDLTGVGCSLPENAPAVEPESGAQESKPVTITLNISLDPDADPETAELLKLLLRRALKQ